MSTRNTPKYPRSVAPSRHRQHMQRRSLLKWMGGASLLAPFVPTALVGAGPPASTRPENLLLVFWPNGLERGWEPTGPEDDYDMSVTLAGFKDLRDKMVLLGGLKGGMTNDILAHDEGMPCMWTGARGNSTNTLVENPSIDQIVADAISTDTPFRSLEFGVGALTKPADTTNVMVFTGPGQPLLAEDDPNAMFNRVFGAPMASPAELARLRARKQSVLDVVRGSLGDVRGYYGGEERAKVDAHLDAIRSIEERLTADVDLSCGDGYMPHALGDQGIHQAVNLEQVLDLQTDILVRSLACRMTRVASLQLSFTGPDIQIPGVNPDFGFHQVMHERTAAEKRAVNRYFVDRLAGVLARLEAEVYTDGTTLLDHTLVVCGSEMSIGNHGNYPIPFFMAGGGGSPIALGRWLDLSKQVPRTSRLMVSIAHAMGLEDMQSFGSYADPESVGPLEELFT